MQISTVCAQHHAQQIHCSRVDLYSGLCRPARHIVLYHTCIMDKEGICSPEWILYIDCKAIFTNGGHYQKTSSSMSGEILSKLNLAAADWDINTFPLSLSCTIILVTLDSCYCDACFSSLSLPMSLPCLGATDSASSSSSSSSSFVNGATSKNLPAVQTVAPMPEDTMENMRSELSTSQSSLSLQPFTFLPLFLFFLPFGFCFYVDLSLFLGACRFSHFIPVPLSLHT